MSRKKETGIYSQSKMTKYSFNFKKQTHESFIEVHKRLEELSGGDSFTKTDVMEWAINLAEYTLKKREELVIKRFNTQQ
jgi:hypothetical protein